VCPRLWMVPLGKLGTPYPRRIWWRRRSCRWFMPALREAEGNPGSKLPSSHDSSASTGFRAFALRRESRVIQSTPLPLACAGLSSLRPCLGCVRRTGAGDLRQLPRRMNRRHIAGYSRNAFRSVPLGKLGAPYPRRIWWRRGESNPRPKSATPRSLHAYLSSVWFAFRA